MPDFKVLIVEDDKQNAEIQHRFVEKIDGFEVVGIAHTLEEAKDLLEVMQPNLLLLDIHFPRGNGLEFLRKIRAGNQAADVILISAAKEVAALQEALHAGVIDFILKPLVFDRLREALDKYRDNRLKLQTIELVRQQDVDQFLSRGTNSAPQEQHLPKGIDPITLKKVESIFSEDNAVRLSAEEVGQQVGASRTTARRYLEYLISMNTLRADVLYGTVGRPERLYTKT